MGPQEVRHRKKGVSIEVIEALLELQECLRREAELFREVEDILVDFYPERRRCELHGTPLLVLKTDTREVRSAEYPPLRARKVHLYCPSCKALPEGTGGSDWRHAPEVPLLTRGKSPFPMDVVARVGMMKFLDCMRRDGIQEVLEREHGVQASTGAVSAMCMEFLARVKCLHELRFERLARDIEAGGGYVLGLDGTGDGDSERVLAQMDLLRDWVLAAARVPSESEESMKPHLEHLREALGLPLVSLCDMATSMMNVLGGVMPDVPLRVCHYHFTDDVGDDLMRADYMAVRGLVIGTGLRPYLVRLRKGLYHELEGVDVSRAARGLRSGQLPGGLPLETWVKVQVYDVVSWMLRYHEDSGGMRFPYSLPYVNFYERCGRGLGAVTSIREAAAEGRLSPRYLRELESRLREVHEGDGGEAEALRGHVASVRDGYALFEELRERLRIPRGKGDIPRDKLIVHSNAAIARMRADLEAFREELRELASDGEHPGEDLVVEHLDRYWPYLVVDNAVVEIDGKEVLIEVPRTTSGNETSFGGMKSDVRKRVGKKDIGRELNMYGDYLCYVQNLRSESYVSLMYGSLEALAEAFEGIPPEMVREEMGALRKRMRGYDVTNSGLRDERIELEDILGGVDAIREWIEHGSLGEYIKPSGLLGIKSNGFLTL